MKASLRKVLLWVEQTPRRTVSISVSIYSLLHMVAFVCLLLKERLGKFVYMWEQANILNSLLV